MEIMFAHIGEVVGSHFKKHLELILLHHFEYILLIGRFQEFRI